VNLSEIVISDKSFYEMAVKIDPKNADELYQSGWLKIREMELKKPIDTNNPKAYFYMTLKSIFIDNKRRDKLANEYRHVTIEQTSYQMALDVVLAEDNELSSLIKLYLVMPNLKNISTFTNIDYKTVKKLYKDARNYIKSISDGMADDDHFNSYYDSCAEYTLLD